MEKENPEKDENVLNNSEKDSNDNSEPAAIVNEENLNSEISEESLKKKILEVTDFINSVKENLELRNERDKYKDEAIQRMSKQISDYEKGFVEQIKSPLINDVILFYDSLLKFQNKFKDIDNSDLQNEIELLGFEVEEILFRNDIKEIEINIGETYNRDIHKVKSKVETKKDSENSTVNNVIKKGFRSGNKIIRKQEIIINEYIDNSENE
jgi:molecular chaperone GrpE (heat shock protein)